MTKSSIFASIVIATGIVVVIVAAIAAPPATEAPRLGYGITTAGVPEGAKIVLETSKAQYFLGENVIIQFGVRNTSDKPFKVETGGDYRGSSRALRFIVTAVDAEGHEMPDPDPSGFNMGGMSSAPEVKPGDTFWAGIPLIRYRNFDKPGEYTIRVRHDLGWGVPAKDQPIGEIHLKLVIPDAEQAAQVVADMVALGRDSGGTMGRQRGDYADFTALRYPIYLPILRQRAESGEKGTCAGIGAIETPEATATLVELLADKHPDVVLEAAQSLTMRLPDPDFTGTEPKRGAPFLDPRLEHRRALAAVSWKPEFTDRVRTTARGLLDLDQPHAAIGAFMLECVGTGEDLASVTAAFERVILSSRQRTWKADDFPSGPPNADALERAVRQIVKRGGKVPAAPKAVGDQAVFAIAVNRDVTFRPAGWELVFAGMLASDVPYQRQEALVQMPMPVPEPLLDAIERCAEDADLGVQCRALELVAKIKSPRFAPIVERILRTDHREWVLQYADQAAFTLELPNRMDIWVDRMAEPGMAQKSMSRLMALVDSNGWSWNSNESSDQGSVPKLWKDFLAAHRDEIRTGKKFTPAKEGGITEAMIPQGMTISINGKEWPPKKPSP